MKVTESDPVGRLCQTPWGAFFRKAPPRRFTETPYNSPASRVSAHPLRFPYFSSFTPIVWSLEFGIFLPLLSVAERRRPASFLPHVISSMADTTSHTLDDPHAHAHDDHHDLHWIWKYVFSSDHKVIGIQYGLTGLVFLFFGFCLM